MSVSKSELFVIRCDMSAYAIRAALVGATNDEIPADALLTDVEFEDNMPGIVRPQVRFSFERRIKA